MKLWLKTLTFTIVFTVIAQLFGCGDSSTNTPPPNNTGETINGRLIDNVGAPIAGIRVMIGSVIDTTDANGNFSVTGVTTPYDLMIFYSTAVSEGVLYKGLTTTAPVLVPPPFTGSQNTASLTVSIPAMVTGQRAFVVFTDQNNIQEQGIIIPPNNSVTLNVRWNGNSTVSGKVIVFVTNYLNGLVQSYEKYGEKSQNVNNGGNLNTVLIETDLSTNPVESNISGALTLPGGYVQPTTALQLNYKTGGSLLYPFSSGASHSEAAGLTYNFVVPTGLPTSFRFVISGSANGVNLEEFTSKSVITTAGTSNNLISPETFSTLSSPANNSTNVNLGTTFSINGGSGSGVYVYTFDGPDRVFYVVTTQSSITFPDFSAMGLGIGSSIDYDWRVLKYGSTQSIDQFVSGNFYDNQNMINYSSSAEWNFETAP